MNESQEEKKELFSILERLAKKSFDGYEAQAIDQAVFEIEALNSQLCKRIQELEFALYRMYDCKYEPDKLQCIYERAVPLKRRAALSGKD